MRPLKSFFTIAVLLGVLITPFAFIPLVNAQGEVTLNPTDDTYTYSIDSFSNYGGRSELEVSEFEYVGTTYEKIGWLKFDLSDIPDGAVVDVATLGLYCSLISETYNVYAHQSSDNSWTELTLTYSDMPSFNATPMDSTVVSTSSEWYSWNVIDAVRKAVDGIHGGPDVVTIVLLETSLHSAFSTASFYSKDQATYVPYLTVHWSGVIPEFPTWTSMLIILVVLTVAISIYKRRLLKTPTH